MAIRFGRSWMTLIVVCFTLGWRLCMMRSCASVTGSCAIEAWVLSSLGTHNLHLERSLAYCHPNPLEREIRRKFLTFPLYPTTQSCRTRSLWSLFHDSTALALACFALPGVRCYFAGRNGLPDANGDHPAGTYMLNPEVRFKSVLHNNGVPQS